MDVMEKREFIAGYMSRRKSVVSSRAVVCFFLWVFVALVLPASPAGAQSQFLEGIDLLYRNYDMTTAYTEGRLTGDFLNAKMRLDAGDVTRHTIAGSYNPATVGAPEGEANGFYAAFHSAGVEMDDSFSGYDADASGYSVGYARWYGDSLYALNFTSVSADAEFAGTGLGESGEDQDMLSFGLHTMGIHFDNWTLRGHVAGFTAKHDYAGITGDTMDIAERAKYDSYGVDALATVGYMVDLGAGGMLLPEAGGQYRYTYRESFTTDAESADYAMTADRFYDNQVTGIVSLKWTKLARLFNIDMMPSVAVGARMLLTDDQIWETRTVGDTTTTISNELETLTTTVSASLLMHITGHLQAAVSYDAEFGGDATQDLLSFRLYFPF